MTEIVIIPKIKRPRENKSGWPLRKVIRTYHDPTKRTLTLNFVNRVAVKLECGHAVTTSTPPKLLKRC